MENESGTVAKISLTEHTPTTCDLEPSDLEYLKVCGFTDLFDFRRDLSGHLVINPGQYVGVIDLPSGLLLESLPKISISNLFRMMTAAYGMPFIELPASLGSLEGILEFLAIHFAQLVEVKIEEGLNREYLEHSDNLPAIRGRIDFQADVRQNLVMRQRTACRFAELSWDTADNQVLRQVIRLLLNLGFSPRLQGQLARLDSMLEEVTAGQFVASDVARFSYHRQNAGYRELHSLCILMLEYLGISHRAGAQGFKSFIIDMNRLFEGFIRESVASRAPGGLSVSNAAAYGHLYLDTEGRVPIRPDVLAYRRKHVRLVLDCKYKRRGEATSSNADLYQAVSYCAALNVKRAILVYPSDADLNSSRILIRGGEIAIEQAWVNLSGSWNQVMDSCDSLAALAFGADQLLLSAG